jgi:y4mF family transcriptional regulator
MAEVKNKAGNGGVGALVSGIAGVFEVMGQSYVVPKGTSIKTTSDVGSRVREARKAMHLTQQSFADLAGVGRRFVSELEAGKPTLEFGRVLKVCEAAGIDLFALPRSTVLQQVKT